MLSCLLPKRSTASAYPVYTIVSNCLAYPSTFSMTTRLTSFSGSSPASAPAAGKKIWPSRTVQPRWWANSTTAPSESRKSRDLVDDSGREG